MVEINSLHILLTFECNYECEHCFVWGSPHQHGTFALTQLVNVFCQAVQQKSIRQIYFEGGEPFLYFPILVKAVSHASSLGFETGIVSNGYWANSIGDALAWLEPLAQAGLNCLEVSCDTFHGERPCAAKIEHVLAAARQLGLETGTISLAEPVAQRDPAAAEPGAPVADGGIMFRGRAAEKLTADLPRYPLETFDNCPYENLVDPGRIHLDPLGNLHICQGVVIGNLFEQPLKQILADYAPANHPIVGPMLAGGPACLAATYNFTDGDGYVDACHLCYTVRQSLRRQFPHILAPDQMYGLPAAGN